MNRALVAMVSTAISFVPHVASACAVCFSGRTDETRVAFVETTVLLTSLPLLLVGSLIWWLWRRAHPIRDERD